MYFIYLTNIVRLGLNMNMTIFNVYKQPKLSIVHFITHISLLESVQTDSYCPKNRLKTNKSLNTTRLKDVFSAFEQAIKESTTDGFKKISQNLNILNLDGKFQIYI